MLYNPIIEEAISNVEKEIKIVNKRELYSINLFYDKSNRAIWNRNFLELLKTEKRILGFCRQKYQEQFKEYIQKFRDKEKEIKVLEKSRKMWLKDSSIDELKKIIKLNSPLDDFFVIPIKISTLKELLNKAKARTI